MIGTNNGVNEPAEETAAQIRACLREIRERQPRAKILLCPILPRGTPDSVERGKNDAVNELLKPLADGKTIVWTDYSGFITLPDGRMNPALTDDGLHPNAKGYAEWAKVALPKLRADLSRENRSDSRKASPVSSVLPAKNSSVNSAPLREIKIIEAKDYSKSVAPDGFRWEFLPGLGYGEGAMEVFPRLGSPVGAKLAYKVKIPRGAKTVDVEVVTRSTLAFARPEGHRYAVGFAGREVKEVNFNARLNEKPENIYSVFYPTVARRVVRTKMTLDVPSELDASEIVVLELSPLDPGIAFEQVSITRSGDCSR